MITIYLLKENHSKKIGHMVGGTVTASKDNEVKSTLSLPVFSLKVFLGKECIKMDMAIMLAPSENIMFRQEENTLLPATSVAGH
jgi:hypothetical protein